MFERVFKELSAMLDQILSANAFPVFVWFPDKKYISNMLSEK